MSRFPVTLLHCRNWIWKFSVLAGRLRPGNAILSRHPLSILRAAELPAPTNLTLVERRGAIWTRIGIGGSEVQVVSTHLGLRSTERHLQAEALLGPEWLDSPTFHKPLILCGDFNSSAASFVYSRIRERFRDAFQHSGSTRSATWPSIFPADQSGLLVDARDYYRAFVHAALEARNYILMAGWQFDSNVLLLRIRTNKMVTEKTGLLFAWSLSCLLERIH